MTQITAPWIKDAAAQSVCRMLTDAGHQAWFVGGCVRNALLGEPVADLDLSTNAHPETVIALAQASALKVVPTGIEHGTVTVIANDTPFEITTFRRDVATDGRRATVVFADNMADDARRRDFTMNALYAAPDGQIMDPLGGLADLRARRVRFIEDADQRIKEDYLRILRFFRFYAWYGDPNEGPDADGLAACAAHLDGWQSLSIERVTSEMLKLLAAPDPAPAVAGVERAGGE
ncbi:MAG: CCA tRNA nucleotidyltransferase, partial [Paracoccaceae bacterium]|nr:CCA tRNA nucleotidyltransferase [Paracoccaceae bacterium]